MRVLIVEDSPMMRRLLIFAMSRVAEFEVVEAENGLSAASLVSDENFDLIITDLNMPRMDGLKLISHIRAESKHVETPIIVVTTEKGSADRERAESLGANAFVTKPIRAPAIIAEARKLLNL